MKYTAKEYHRLYDRAQWKRLRLQHLQIEPLCRFCTQAGLTVNATIVDHIKPHKGDETLFFDAENLQSLCKQCHDKAKSIIEKHGYLIGSTTQGLPLDYNHHWHEGMDTK